MADTTVTGRIGDQDVALINAASEATLLKLLEAMQGKGGGSSGSGSAAKTQELYNKAQVEGTKQTGAASKALNTLGKSVGMLASAIVKATGALLNFAGNIVGGLIKGVVAISQELLLGGDRVSDFTKHLADLPSILGVVGGAIHALSAFVDKNVDVWRELAATGAAFNNNIFDMRKSAADAGMNLDKFANLVKGNAQTMAMFGGSVTQGAQNFGRLSKNMREQFGDQLMSMGFTMEDMNETLLTYSNINAQLGRNRATSDADLIEQSAAFALELDKAAKASGVSRKALESSASAAMNDAKLRVQIGAITDKEAKARALANLGFVDSMKTLAPAMKDLASGIPMTEEGIMLNNMANGQMSKLMKQAMDGQIDSVELNNRLVAMYPEMEKKAKAMGPNYIKALTASMSSMGVVLNGMGEMAVLTEKDRKKIEDEQKKREAITGFFASFEKAITLFRARLESIFLSSNVFKRIHAMFANLVNGEGGKIAELLDDIANGFKSFLEYIDVFLTDIETVGLKQAVVSRLEGLIMDVFNIKPEDLAGKGEDGKDKALSTAVMEKVSGALSEGFKFVFSAMGTAIKEGIIGLFKENPVISTLVAAIAALWAGAKIKGMIAGPASAAGGAMGGGAASLGQGMGAGIKGLAGGLSALANPMALIGLGAITLAIMGLAKAFEIASPGFEAFGKMIKSVLEGVAPVIESFGTAVSTVMQGVGTAISNAKEGFEVIFNGIADVVKSIGDVIVGSITAIGDGISKVIDSISNLSTAGTKATTDQIERLSAIPSDNMFKAAQGIEAMKRALEDFTPGIFSGLSTGLGSLFAADKVGPLEKLAELGPRLDAAAPGFNNLKAAMAGFSLANLMVTSDQVDNLADLSKKLPTLAEGLNAVGDTAPKLNASVEAIVAFKAATEGFSLKEFNFTSDQLKNLDAGTSKLRTLSTQLSATADNFKKLDNTGLDKIKKGIESLSDSFGAFNAMFKGDFMVTLDKIRSESQTGLLTEMGSKLDTLNSSMAALVGIETESKNSLNTIANKRPGKLN
jgi:hypothetical protein